MSVQIPLFDKTDSKTTKAVAKVDEIVDGGFDVKRLIENFEVLASALGGVERLRAMTLHLAVNGRLSPDGTSGWAQATVADVADCRLGKMLDKAKNRGKLLPYLRNTNVHWFRLDLADIKQMPFEDRECAEYELRPGDLVICEGGHGIGRCAVWNGELTPMMFQKALHRLRPRSFMNSTFLAYQLKIAADTGIMAGYFTGAGILHLTGRKLAEIRVVIPPTDEQQRIVAKVKRLIQLCDDLEARQAKKRETAVRLNRAALDALTSAEGPEEVATSFRRVAENFEELIHTPESVGELRSAILDLAVRGRLVEQRSREPSATVLLNTLTTRKNQLVNGGRSNGRQSRDELVRGKEPYLLPSGWGWARVDDMYDVAGGIQKTPHRAPVQNHFPYLRVENVQRGRLNLTRVERFELFEDELERRRLEVDDILVVEGNGSETEIGRCAIWDGSIANCVHQNHIIRCRPMDRATSTFTLLFFNSPAGMSEMRELAITTSGLYSLSVGKIRGIMVPVPPLAEQARIVAKVDQLMALCDTLEAALRRADTTAQKLAEAVVAELVA